MTGGRLRKGGNDMTALVEKTTRTATVAGPIQESLGRVHCPMCTHRVDAMVQSARRMSRVKPGQKCPRCKASLDAGFVLEAATAARALAA